MPKMEMDWKLTPQTFISGANFLAIIFVAYGSYVSLGNDVKQDRASIAEIQTQLAALRAASDTTVSKLQSKDESILGIVQQQQVAFGTRLTKLESDTSYIKESVSRIERVQATGTARP